MAGSRTPSPNAEHRNREAGWITLPNHGPDGKAPSVSLAGRGLSTSQQAKGRKLWAEWWGSPVAVMWSPEVDRYGLERLLVLTVRSWEGVSASELSEIRQLEDRYGLSPQARRKLYWRIEGVDLPSTASADLSGKPAGSVLPKSGGKGDPRLRLVAGEKSG